jgi:hypothetical protein
MHKYRHTLLQSHIYCPLDDQAYLSDLVELCIVFAMVIADINFESSN